MVLDSLAHSTTGLTAVGAARKAALPEIGSELREGVLQIILRDAAELLRLQAGKARRIGQAATADLEDFHLTGSVAAAAQLLADLPGLAVQRGGQRVEQRRFTDAGVAAEGAEMPFNIALDLVKALAGLIVQLYILRIK